MTAWTTSLNRRCREIGEEILERAFAARPRWWQSAWWEERAQAFATNDPRLKVQLFRFTEVLPALKSDADIARHLKEYLTEPQVRVPLILQAMTAYRDPSTVCAKLVAQAARVGAYSMAGRFITGLTERQAIAAVSRLRDQNMTFTLDVLGETTSSARQADKYAQSYLQLLDTLSPVAKSWPSNPTLDESAYGPMPRINVSIKLTSLEPRFDTIDPEGTSERVCRRLRPILRKARQLGALVNVDMEHYHVRDLTLRLFMNLLDEPEFQDWPDVGIVVQAYLQDSEDDLLTLLDWAKRRGRGIAIRLVKGAYWDYETTVAVKSGGRIPVWTEKWQSDAHYERLAKIMLDHHELIRPAFASHNVRSLAFVMAYAESIGLTPRHYELQMLHGMGDPLKTAIVAMGQCLRIYAPIGDLVPGMAYLIRRLLENSSNESFLRQSFRERVSPDRLLANPAVARPPSAELPKRHFVDPFEEMTMIDFTHARNTSLASAENREKMRAALKYVRGEFGREVPLLIGDREVRTDSWIESRNPSKTTECVGRVAAATSAEADQAVAAAAKAFTDWSHQSATQRADIIRKAADMMESRRFELAAWLILEAGKPWKEADAEVSEAIDYCRFYAAQMELLERRPRRRNLPGEDNVMVHEPRGVCVVISTWAFPLALLANMTAAALAAGNSVVVKPASLTPVVASKFVEILRKAGIPAGVVNYLPGEGSSVGLHLVQHPGVPTVAFTGSRQVGVEVLERTAIVRPRQQHLKHIIAHLGGKNAVIVDSDADLDAAAIGVAESAFASAGQKCSACSRVVVLADVAESFTRRLAEVVRTYMVGPAEDPTTFVGPIVDAGRAGRIRGWIEAGKTVGRLVLAVDTSQLMGGEFVGPTIIADLPPNHELTQEEVFGPILLVMTAKDFDQALEIANGTPYALTGGVFSRSPVNLRRARQEFRVGNLYINRKITGSVVDIQPWGGLGMSGNGPKAGGDDFLTQFCDSRTISENTLRHGFAPSDEIEAAVKS